MEIATISLIISASVAIAVIYRDVFHERFFKPDLKVMFSLEEPVSRETFINVKTPSLEDPKYKLSFWPRLRIKNTGRSVARRCEGVLAEVRNPNGELDDRYDPLILRWAIAPIRRGLEPLDIARGRAVDLNTFFTIEGASKAQFATHPDQRGVPLDLEPGDYWLRIVIYGDNFRPIEKGYAVHWEGNQYNRVDMQEMKEQPNSSRYWPWPIQQA